MADDSVARLEEVAAAPDSGWQQQRAARLADEAVADGPPDTPGRTVTPWWCMSMRSIWLMSTAGWLALTCRCRWGGLGCRR